MCEALFQSMLVILKRHGLDSYLEGYDGELISLLMQNHIEKVREAETYKACQKMMNEVIAAQMGVGITVDQFMPSKDDQCEFYALFVLWRSQLLGAAQASPPPAVNASATVSTV